MPKNFPYEMAAYTLAVGTYFSRKKACSICKVKEGTYDKWLQRKKTDPRLQELFIEEHQKINQQWVGNATKTLNMTFLKMQEAYDAINFQDVKINSPAELESWAKALKALADTAKSVGDITIGGEVLHEEDIEEEKRRERERLEWQESEE